MKPKSLLPSLLCPILLAAGLATGAVHGAAVIIDDNDLIGFSQTGGWGVQSRPDAQSGNWRYQNDAAGVHTATYSFSGLTNGIYRVSSAWTTGGNRPTDARYSIDGGPTITLDQQIAPNDDTFEGVGWEDLFTVEVIDGGLTVKLDNAAGGGGGTALIADAVRLELIPEPAAALLGGLGLLILLCRRRVG